MLISNVSGAMDFSSSGLVNSTQKFSIVIAAGSTSNTFTINSVSTGNSAIFYGGSRDPNTVVNASTDLGSLILTDSTTVTATRNTSDATNALTINGTVVEFVSSKIASVQVGSVTMTASTSQTATIASVTATNSILLYNGATSNYTSNTNNVYQANIALTNGTTVTASRGVGTNNVTVYFTVVEFNSGVLNSSTQSGSISMSSETSKTATISSVTTSRSMLLWGGFLRQGTGTSAGRDPYIQLTNGTTVTASRTQTNASGSDVVTFMVAEFKTADIQSVNRNVIVIATSDNSNSDTLSGAVVIAKTIAHFLGRNNNASTIPNGKTLATVFLTNTTTVTAQRATADASSTDTVSYEAIEFK